MCFARYDGYCLFYHGFCWVVKEAERGEIGRRHDDKRWKSDDGIVRSSEQTGIESWERLTTGCQREQLWLMHTPRSVAEKPEKPEKPEICMREASLAISRKKQRALQ